MITIEIWKFVALAWAWQITCGYLAYKIGVHDGKLKKS